MDNNRFTYENALTVEMNSDTIREMVKMKAGEIDAALLSGGVEVGEEDIRITKGAKAMPLDVDKLCAMIEQAMREANREALTYESELEMAEALISRHCTMRSSPSPWTRCTMKPPIR